MSASDSVRGVSVGAMACATDASSRLRLRAAARVWARGGGGDDDGADTDVPGDFGATVNLEIALGNALGAYGAAASCFGGGAAALDCLAAAREVLFAFAAVFGVFALSLVRGREDAVLAEAGVWDLSSLVGLSTALAHENVSTAELLGLLCEVGHPGEMFTSAAPQDPLFWPVHGLAERFLQYARVLKRRGELDFSEAWGYFHAPSLPSDTGVVCDWSAVAPGSMERPQCARATCPGHRLHDVLPFDDLVLGDASANATATADRRYTNAQFYNLIDPVSGALPYVYDTLAHWPACPGGTLL